MLHSPTSQGIALEPEHPWEVGGLSYLIAFPDQGKYRGWYRADPQLQDSDYNSITCYAESEDGVTWTKPNLGLIEFNGSKDNNIVWMGPGINLAPFKDGNPEAKSDERYKAFIRVRRVMHALSSPDGLRWRMMREEPIHTDYPFDTLNIPFWDTWRKEYVGYFRGVAGQGTSDFFTGVRWIRRGTSQDFLDWSELENIDCGDTPWEHFYTNSCIQYERAPGTYLMFPSRFVHDRTPDPDWTYDTGVSDIVFMSSRDGFNFDRSFMEAFIRPGTDFNNWHDRGIYFEVGILHTSDKQMSMYGMENAHLPTQRIRRYTLRTDGFVSVNGGFRGGSSRHGRSRSAEASLSLTTRLPRSGRSRSRCRTRKDMPSPALDWTTSQRSSVTRSTGRCRGTAEGTWGRLQERQCVSGLYSRTRTSTPSSSGENRACKMLSMMA